MAGEARLQSKVIKFLKLNKIWFVKTKESNRSGIPDIILCKDGKFAAIELKNPETRSQPTALQEYELNMIENSGGNTLASYDYSEIVKFIQNL